MATNSFIGTWSHVDSELTGADGKVSYPWGRNVKGYIMYNKDGYVSVSMMTANRPQMATKDLRGGNTEEKAAAYSTFMAYSGKYEVKDKTVIHHVEVSSFPNWSGVSQVRHFEFEGDRLILSPPPTTVNGKQQVARIIWERV